MKFSLKLVLCASVITAVLFSGGGYLMVKQNFDYALAAAAQQNGYRHTMERYAMESELRNALISGEEITDEKIHEYGSTVNSYLGEQTRQLGVFGSQGEVLFSNLSVLPQSADIRQALAMQGDQYLLKRDGTAVSMLMCSVLDMRTRRLSILNVYDVTAVFEERDRQLRTLLLLDGLVVAVSVAALFVLSLYLTHPIKKLNAASRQIAQGAYEERIHTRSTDEIGQLGESFNTMAQAVEEHVQKLNLSLKQRDDFVSSFSHEIKTPMTSIIGYADILRTSVTDQEKQLKYASYIYQEGKRLEELSHKLMDLMELSGQEAAMKPVEAGVFFHRLRKQMEPEHKNTVLHWQVEACRVLADKSLLDCLLRNLISNARKALEGGGAITVTGKRSGEKYQITVRDNGCGIPREELSRITEPFYMVDKSRARAKGGSGIGLSICHRIALLHGEELLFESKPGEGTAVTFFLEVYHEN